MKINHNYPVDLEFKKNEFKTLEYINNWGLIDYSLSQELATSIYTNYCSYGGTDFNKNPFKIHMDFYMEVEKSINKVIIGANIEGKAGINSYFFAICSADDKELIRKFHFDYAPPLPQIIPDQQVPTFHLQYGGKLTQEIRDMNIGDNMLEHWLSLPRLNFMPINLALLLDMVFCEFHTIETQKVYENPRWRTLVFENEKFLYHHYISNLYNHIQSKRYNKNFLLRDFYYGK